MLTAFLTFLAPLLVAGWALRRLRHRRLLLRALRGKYFSTLGTCEDLVRQLEGLDGAARIAALAQPAPGGKPFNAPLDLISLREDVRNAEESLLQAESEWESGRFDHMYARLSALWAQLDSTRTGVDMFRRRVSEAGKGVPAERGQAALEEQAVQDQEGRSGQAAEIRSRIEREVPRLLAKAGSRVGAAGAWAQARLADAEHEWHEARKAHDSGNLVAADHRSRLARSHALRLVRQIDLGLAQQEQTESAGLAGSLAAALREALLRASPAIGWTLAGMAFASWLTFQIAGRLTGSTEKVLTTSGNLALGKPTRASHALDVPHGSARAVDGDLRTAWVSGASLADAQGLVIDLKAKHALGKVMVLPQAAPAGVCRWEVDVSEDSWTWTRAGQGSARGSASKSEWGGTDLPGGTVARYIRLRPLDWGRSGVAICEIRVFAPSQVLKR